MATIVNERDVLIRSAPSRLIDHDIASNVNLPTFKGISLASPGAMFRIAVNGDVSPTAITLSVSQRGFSEDPPITWAVAYGTLATNPATTGMSYTLSASNMETDVVTISVSTVAAGMTYSDAITFIKVQDGSIGLPGSRGSINAVRAITGTAWSSFEATMALIDFGLEDPFDPIAGDVVTLHNLNAGFSEIRRYSGSVWVLEAPAFPGKNILKGSVATEQLLVTGMAEALNADPNTVDITAWVGNGITVVADTTAPNGATALRCAGQGTTVLSRKFAVNASDNYRVQTWAKAESGAPTAFLAVAFYDASGAVLTGTANPAGWASAGDFHYYGLVNQVMPTTWTNYSASFGVDETFKVPAGATHAAIGLISNFANGTVQRICGMVCRRKIDGRVVVDGAIAAKHVDSRGLSVVNDLGEVLLDATGSNVPPWVVQVLNATDSGALPWGKLTDDFNRSVLRALLVDNVALKASYTPTNNSIRIESSARDIWHVTYAGNFALFVVDGLVPVSHGYFQMAPNTTYVLDIAINARYVSTVSGTVPFPVELKLGVPAGCSGYVAGGSAFTAATASDVVLGTFDTDYDDHAGPPPLQPTARVMLTTGSSGGAFQIKCAALEANIQLGPGTTFSLQRVNNYTVPDTGYAARVGSVRAAGAYPVGTTYNAPEFSCVTVTGQPYKILLTLDSPGGKSMNGESKVSFVNDTSANSRVLLRLETLHSSTQSDGSSINIDRTVNYELLTGVSPSEYGRWSFGMSAVVSSSSWPQFNADSGGILEWGGTYWTPSMPPAGLGVCDVTVTAYYMGVAVGDPWTIRVQVDTN